MNLMRHEAESLAHEIDGVAAEYAPVEIILAPPMSSMQCVAGTIDSVALAAQNFHPEEKGNFTGETSVTMIAEFAKYAIVGHSERRQHFHETDEDINKKVVSALEHGLTPILCFGEDEKQRSAGQTPRIIQEQLHRALAGVRIGGDQEIIAAYEPVWAISGSDSSRVATASEVGEAIDVAHEVLEETLGSLSTSVSLVYGGSTSPENCEEIFAIGRVQGALVGGKSLEADSFLAIAKHLQEA